MQMCEWEEAKENRGRSIQFEYLKSGFVCWVVSKEDQSGDQAETWMVIWLLMFWRKDQSTYLLAIWLAI